MSLTADEIVALHAEFERDPCSPRLGEFVGLQMLRGLQRQLRLLELVNAAMEPYCHWSQDSPTKLDVDYKLRGFPPQLRQLVLLSATEGFVRAWLRAATVIGLVELPRSIHTLDQLYDETYARLFRNSVILPQLHHPVATQATDVGRAVRVFNDAAAGHERAVQDLLVPGFPAYYEAVVRSAIPNEWWDSRWRTDTVRAVAHGVWAGSVPHSILADALQDAGCDCSLGLARLRSQKGPHTRADFLLRRSLDLAY